MHILSNIWVKIKHAHKEIYNNPNLLFLDNTSLLNVTRPLRKSCLTLLNLWDHAPLLQKSLLTSRIL